MSPLNGPSVFYFPVAAPIRIKSMRVTSLHLILYLSSPRDTISKAPNLPHWCSELYTSWIGTPGPYFQFSAAIWLGPLELGARPVSSRASVLAHPESKVNITIRKMVSITSIAFILILLPVEAPRALVQLKIGPHPHI